MSNDTNFENTVREALRGAVRSTPATPDLAERLIANATSGTRRVVSLRSARRFTIPLLAAAACIVVIAGIVLGTRLAADRTTTPPATVQPTPLPTRQETESSKVQESISTSSSPPGPLATPAPTRGSAGITKQSPPVTIASKQGRAAPVSIAPQGFRAASLDFTDGDVGWAIGDASCDTGTAANCPALIRTGDRGASWTTLKVPAGLSSATAGIGCWKGQAAVTACVNRVSFANLEVGYLWGQNHTYLTRDGGTTWTKIKDSAGTTQLSLSGDRVFRARSSGEEPTSAGASLESAAVGAAAFAPLELTGAGAITSYTLIPAGPGTLFVQGLLADGGHQVFRTQDGLSWQLWSQGRACGNGLTIATGALDGSLLIGCIEVGSNSVRVAPAGSMELGPKRELPREVMGSGMLGFGAALSSRDFSILTSRTSPDGNPATGWHRTGNAGVDWNPPRIFRDHAFATEAGITLLQVAGAVFAVDGNGTGIQFSLDGGTTWQSRSF